MTFREMVKELEQLGYSWVRANGGHHIFSHPDANRPMVISNDNKEIGPKMVSRNIKKAKRQIVEGQQLKAKRG